MKARIRAAIWFSALSGSTTLMVEPARAVASLEMPAGTDLGQVVLALCSLVALIVVGAYGLRRVSGMRTRPGTVAMLGGVAVGSRERVVLLKVGDTQVLVGVAPGRVSTLHVFGGEDTSEAQHRPEKILQREELPCA